MRDQAQTLKSRQRVDSGGSAQTNEEPVVGPGGQLLYRIPEVMAMLSMSRSVVFEQLRNGRLRSVRQGRARYIPASAVADYIKLLQREAAEETGQ